MDIVYTIGKTNPADSRSCRPDYKAAVEAEDHQKQAEKQTRDSSEGAQSSTAE